MLKLIASGLVAASVLFGSTAVGAESAIVSKVDRHGDVRVTGSTDGVDPAIVHSVDLRHITVTRQGDGVRVVVRLKQVLPPGRWFQQVGVTLVAPSWTGSPGWVFAAMATPQHLGSAGAFYLEPGDEGDEGVPDPEEEGIDCHLDASKGAKVLSLVIPDRCLPTEGGELSVGSVLIDKRGGDNPLIATDEMTVGGLVDLQPGR